jgi:hypothetical protein
MTRLCVVAVAMVAAWILWSKDDDHPTWRWTIEQAYEQREECQQGLRGLVEWWGELLALMKKRGGVDRDSFVAGNMVRIKRPGKIDTEVRYLCLPESVDPR